MATLLFPLRLEIQMRLSAALQEITAANGYPVEVGASVFRGRLIFGAESPLPMLTILENPIPQEAFEPPPDSTTQSSRWELMVQGFVADDPVNPTDPAHILMAAVKQRLAREKRKAVWDRSSSATGILGLGRNVIAMYIGQGVVRPPDEVSARAYFWLSLTLEIVEDMDDPYTAA